MCFLLCFCEQCKGRRQSNCCLAVPSRNHDTQHQTSPSNLVHSSSVHVVPPRGAQTAQNSLDHTVVVKHMIALALALLVLTSQQHHCCAADGCWLMCPSGCWSSGKQVCRLAAPTLMYCIMHGQHVN